MRELSDETGRRWRVWEVRATPGNPPDGVERRARPRATVREEFRQGWLVFESEETGERIRLAPAPAGWQDLPDEQLMALRKGGTAATARRRLVE